MNGKTHGAKADKRTPGLFASLWRSRGSQAAIAFLNAGVAHRYTGAYRLVDGVLHNVILVDKLGAVRPEHLAAVPLETSFCQYVIRDGLFLTHDSGTDSRLDGHPYQGVMRSYSGVPLIGDGGEIWGTLCHFDLETQDLPDREFKLLQDAAELIPESFDRR